MAERGEPLTERELEIVELVAQGSSNKDIAAALTLSPNTVKVHLRNVFAKLGVQSRTELTMLAVRSGWVAVAGVQAPAAEPGADLAGNASAATGQSAAEPPAEPSRPALPRVAPNPEPLPALAAWRRALLVVALFAIAASIVLALPAAQSATAPRGDATDLDDVPAGNGELLPIGQSTRWFLRAPLSAPRARAVAAAAGGRVYVIGGEVGQAASGDVLVFDPATNAWRQLDAAKPTPVWNAAGAVLGDALHVIGGTPRNGLATDRVEVLDVSTGTWRIGAALPRPTTGHAAAVLEGVLYVFGGRAGGETTADAYALDESTGRWRRVAPMPTPRNLTAAAVLGDRIYVVGGYDDGRELAVCEAYTPATDAWQACAPMTIPRGGHGLVGVGSSLYAVGGGIAGFIGFNERYDPAGDKWTAVETPITGDWRNAAVTALPTEFYVIGGYSNNRRLPFNYVYEALNNRTYLPSLIAPKPTP